MFQLPMLRWKRSAVVAAMCILAVRAVIVQLAFFLHMQVSLDSGFSSVEVIISVFVFSLGT